MKRTLICLKVIFAAGLLYCVSTPTFAVLPPQYENAKDLKVMMDFIYQYPIDVLGKLRVIDFEQRKIIFGDNCEATFVRGKKKPGEPPIGPAAPLVFEKSSCKVAK